MKRFIDHVVAFFGLLLSAAPMAGQGTDNEGQPVQRGSSVPDNDRRGEETMRWDSPKLRELEREWHDIVRSVPDDQRRAKYQETGRKIDRLFRTRLTKTEVREMVAALETLPVDEEEWTHFQLTVRREVMDILLEEGDRKTLVELLSTHCPAQLALRLDIELWVLLDRERKMDDVVAIKMDDPITILGEAYKNSENQANRGVIAAALRRGFTGLGVQGKDDAEFVTNAMKWYDENKAKIEVRMEYAHNATQGDSRKYLRRPLFKFKDRRTDPHGYDE